jgi:hypothetical protein
MLTGDTLNKKGEGNQFKSSILFKWGLLVQIPIFNQTILTS